MSRLLGKYVARDIGLNYDGDVVGYLRGLAYYEGIEYFRDAVFAIPKLVERNFEQVLELEECRRGKHGSVKGVLLARALTHQGIKRKIRLHFEKHSIEMSSIHEQYLKELLNSPSLCSYIKVDGVWSGHHLRSYFTKDSPLQALQQFVDAAAGKHDARTIIGNFCLLQPKLIRNVQRRHFEQMKEEDVIKLLGKLKTKKFIDYVISHNISFDSDTADYVGQVITLQSMNSRVTPSAAKMYRLLSS